MNPLKPWLWLLAFLAGLLLFAPAGAAPDREPAAAATPAHLDLEVMLSPGTHELQAVATLVAWADFTFVLHQSLSVRAVSANGEAVNARVVREHGDLRVWRVPAAPGAKLRMRYGGTLPALDRSVTARGVLRGLSPVTAPRGSYLPAGSGWYPRPARLFTYRVELVLPADQRGLVPGRMISESLPSASDPHYRATFVFRHPARGIALMAGPYDIRESRLTLANGEPIRLRTYFYPELAALADDYLQASARYIQLYSQWIGNYPFAGFSVVASPLPTGFGMPTLTYLGARILPFSFIIGRSLGHEVLHNWWGNGVYVDDAAGNWSEGLTTFMADYFYRTRNSAGAARRMRLNWLRNFAAIPAGAHQSLASFRSRTHGAGQIVGYNKAAMVFVMLRDLIGKEAFTRGIRLFWQRNHFQVASWGDLRRAFEDAADRSLNVFFRQWVHRVGGPKLAIEKASARTSAGRTRVTLTLTQSAPPYQLHVPLAFIDETHAETRWVQLDETRAKLTLTFDWQPDSVRLDPNFRLWRVLDADVLTPILREWMIARAPRLVIVSRGDDVTSAARMLAARLFEAHARRVPAGAIDDGTSPVLVIGLHDDIDKLLAARDWGPRPDKVGGRGTAQVWTLAQKDKGAPVAVISARGAEALSALAGPLPHYGNESYVVFDGSKIVAQGVWRVRVPAVSIIYQAGQGQATGSASATR